MATYTFVDFEHPEASELARLHSIKHDLSSVIDLCRYFDATPEEQGRMELIDAFTTAILVRYSRAFVSGVRRGLGEDALATFTSQQREDHERLRAFRDKHIAHSVNAFEDTRIQARFCAERVNEEGITSISAAHYRVVGLSGNDLHTLIDLTTKLLEHVEAAIKDEQVRLLTFVRQIPIAEVLTAPSRPLLTPDHENIARRRQAS